MTREPILKVQYEKEEFMIVVKSFEAIRKLNPGKDSFHICAIFFSICIEIMDQSAPNLSEASKTMRELIDDHEERANTRGQK